MKETYLSRDFRETAAHCFPSQAKELNAFFDARLNVLLAENSGQAFFLIRTKGKSGRNPRYKGTISRRT